MGRGGQGMLPQAATGLWVTRAAACRVPGCSLWVRCSFEGCSGVQRVVLGDCRLLSVPWVAVRGNGSSGSDLCTPRRVPLPALLCQRSLQPSGMSPGNGKGRCPPMHVAADCRYASPVPGFGCFGSGHGAQPGLKADSWQRALQCHAAPLGRHLHSPCHQGVPLPRAVPAGCGAGEPGCTAPMARSGQPLDGTQLCWRLGRGTQGQGGRAGRVCVCVCVCTFLQGEAAQGGDCHWVMPGVPPVVQGAKRIPLTRIVFLGSASNGPKGLVPACSVPHPAVGEPGHYHGLDGRVTSCQLWDMPGHPVCIYTYICDIFDIYI